MSYIRVIPRDLFNEANLLKCLGQVYLNLERMPSRYVDMLQHDGAPFEIEQDCDGALSVNNVTLAGRVRKGPYYFTRPLNSRREWPLYLTYGAGEEVEVFNESGGFSLDMLEFMESL